MEIGVDLFINNNNSKDLIMEGLEYSKILTLLDLGLLLLLPLTITKRLTLLVLELKIPPTQMRHLVPTPNLTNFRFLLFSYYISE
jgi:hypothetical protein